MNIRCLLLGMILLFPVHSLLHAQTRKDNTKETPGMIQTIQNRNTDDGKIVYIINGMYVSNEGLEIIKLRVRKDEKKTTVLAYNRPDPETGQDYWVNIPIGRGTATEVKSGGDTSYRINIRPYGDVYFESGFTKK